MKVALVGPYPLDPLMIDGGVEAACYYLSQGLREQRDVALDIVSATKSVDADQLVRDGDVAIHYLAKPKRRIVPNMITTIGRLRDVLDRLQPDVVHAQEPCSALAGITGGYPTVFTIHAVVHRESQYYGSGLATRLNMALFNYLTRKAIARASHVLPVSSYVEEQYKNLINSGATVVANAVDDRFFSVADNAIPGRLLYVGLVGPRKNVLGLVSSFGEVKRSVPSSELVIAGPIRDEAHYSQVVERVRFLGLEDSVHFVGSLNQDQLVEEHSKAAAVCIFSSHETFSLTVSQGMAAGKPVVSTDSGGPSDLITDGETGFLVRVGDEKAFAERLVTVLSDPDLRHRMGSNGRDVARVRFTKEAIASQTVGVYHQVIQNARS